MVYKNNVITKTAAAIFAWSQSAQEKTIKYPEATERQKLYEQFFKETLNFD